MSLNTSTSSKFLDLAKKLKTLSERGEKGERQNAEKFLHRLLKKHKISIESLDSDVERYHIFKVGRDQYERSLFQQVVYSILVNYQLYQNKKRPTELVLKTTDYTSIEIRNKFDFYLKEYRKQSDIFYKSFIHKNKIVPLDKPEANREDTPQKLSEKELEEVAQIKMMMTGMSSKTYHKPLK